MYQLACCLRAQRHKYRVIYVNKATSNYLIRDTIISLISVLHSEVDKEALKCLRGAIDYKNSMIGGQVSVVNCLKTSLDTIQTRGLTVISILDQCNNIYACEESLKIILTVSKIIFICSIILQKEYINIDACVILGTRICVVFMSEVS